MNPGDSNGSNLIGIIWADVLIVLERPTSPVELSNGWLVIAGRCGDEDEKEELALLLGWLEWKGRQEGLGCSSLWPVVEHGTRSTPRKPGPRMTSSRVLVYGMFLATSQPYKPRGRAVLRRKVPLCGWCVVSFSCMWLAFDVIAEQGINEAKVVKARRETTSTKWQAAVLTSLAHCKCSVWAASGGITY